MRLTLEKVYKRCATDMLTLEMSERCLLYITLKIYIMCSNPKHLDGGDFSSVVKMYFSITGTGTWGMSQKKTKEAHSASLP